MIALLALSAVVGLIVGSFLNVVIYRVPLGKSVVSPRSSCPRCGVPIAGYDNIPVLSWVLLRGRCRHCGETISVRYPLVELGTGVAFTAVAALFLPAVLHSSSLARAISASLVLVAFLYLCAIAIALALIDLDVHRLPNAIVLPSYLVVAVLFAVSAGLTGAYGPLLRAALAMVAVGATYLLLALIYPRGMGMGDVKLAGLIGLMLGWLGWGPVLFGGLVAFFLGGVFGVILMIAGRATRKSGIPFGPWMLIGAALGVVFGASVLRGYLSIIGISAA